ncbi:GntR family transcriptional regulator [Plesiomonas sp.]|uniref:GntR family transcriptional regulator n=1 Tax=Plesiomonas sp. TaxID=2486279 RepID=UPI003F34EDAB
MSSQTITDKIFHIIKKDILLGILKPSQKLVVAELKEHYGVGASPIREALIKLSWSKFVCIEPQKGCWVSPVSIAELDDILETRQVLERILLTKSIEQGGEEWELNVLTSHHKLARIDDPANPNIDYDEWEIRHNQFHMALFSGSNNPKMQEFLQNILEQIARYRHVWVSVHLDYDKRYHDNGEHEQLMQAVLNRDIHRAITLTEQHSNRAFNLFKKSIQQLEHMNTEKTLST